MKGESIESELKFKVTKVGKKAERGKIGERPKDEKKI